MEETASRTAMSTALMRAAHTRLAGRPLFQDPWGERLVPEHVREALRRDALERLKTGDPTAPDARDENFLFRMLSRSPPFANVIMRSRYTEDALATAVAAGVSQYVLIGAGFDSFSLRRPAYARDITIFEIDHPATQALKRERLAELGIEPCAPLHFIAADLSSESLRHALARSPYSPQRLTFFSWLGVTMYLTREANFETFRAIAACAPPGSQLAFTYLDQYAFDSPTPRFAAIQQRLQRLGEPFLSGLHPRDLAAELRHIGLELIDDVDGAEAALRYDRDGTLGFERSGASHLALARVTDVPAR